MVIPSRWGEGLNSSCQMVNVGLSRRAGNPLQLLFLSDTLIGTWFLLIKVNYFSEISAVFNAFQPATLKSLTQFFGNCVSVA